MKKHTNQQKINGELAARSLSLKARNFIDDTDPLTIYQVETDEGTRFDMESCVGQYENITFEELQSNLEELADIFGEEEE